MKKKSVLVTGGAGFIGTHTTVELVEAGYDVVVVDDLSNSDMSGIEGVRKITGVDVPLVVVDCCDEESLKNEVFEHYKELEAIGLAAPQVTYITHALKEHGVPIGDHITTVEEAKDAILKLLNQ